MVRAAYRVRQVLHALRPRIDEAELAIAREQLLEGESRLFFAMERRDQRHALEVARRLRVGTDDRALLAAALLHDCGKGSMPIWLRVLNVLSPGLVDRLGHGKGRGVRGAAFRLREHPRLGAELAEAAGSSPRTVRLIRGHIEPDEAWMHQVLAAADDAS